MRKRDLGILLLCAFAIFFSLQNEGDFSFREAWFYPLDDSYPFKHEAELLPPPVVTDLNGDGHKEILVATRDAEIQILEPHFRSSDGGFSDAHLLATVSLLPERVRVAAGRQPVAMAAGAIQRVGEGERRKEVVVVLTAGWNIICFDHNLKKLWEADVQEDFPHGAHHREVSILITNYTLKHGDNGLIIVGGSMEVQPHLFLDPFEEVLVSEREAERHRHSATEKENTEDLSAQVSSGETRHMTYYAFAGGSGLVRWKHKSKDFSPSFHESEVLPQHSYKLDANSMNSRSKGQVACREYRESILGIMPHQWDRRDDTRFELSHFRKHKRRLHKSLQGRNRFGISSPEEKHTPGKDSTNKIANVIGKAAELAAKKHVKRSYFIPTITNYTNYWWLPNVIVAHLKDGVEAVHLASGRTLCKLLLQEGGLHADVNGDGVLDHVQAVGGNGAEQFVPTGMVETLRPCTAIATSGVPSREQLFNGSICRHYSFGGFQHSEYASRSFGHRGDSSPIEVATPILLPTYDGHRHRRGSHGDIIFLTSHGEVTSYTPGLHGKGAVRHWQVVSGATWSNPHFQTGIVMGKTIPTLAAMPLRVHGPLNVILVAGDQEAVLLSASGRQLANLLLPAAPIHPILIADFSGDGLNDLIVVTTSGVYGFVQAQQPGQLLFSSLVGLLIVVMVIVFVIQHFSLPKVKPRAPDR
eukprot:c26740_g1_i2 orf=290-2380(+)